MEGAAHGGQPASNTGARSNVEVRFLRPPLMESTAHGGQLVWKTSGRLASTFDSSTFRRWKQNRTGLRASLLRSAASCAGFRVLLLPRRKVSGRGLVWKSACLGDRRSPVRIRPPRPCRDRVTATRRAHNPMPLAKWVQFPSPATAPSSSGLDRGLSSRMCEFDPRRGHNRCSTGLLSHRGCREFNRRLEPYPHQQLFGPIV